MIMKKLLEKLLAFWARKIIVKYQPKVVGITGSIGKTSAKEAIFSVLNSKFQVRENIKNYNNEIGVPLTIIGCESGGKSLIKWLKVFCQAFTLLIWRQKNYPEILVLEMGADHPGDIEYLINIVPCDIGVVTKVAPVHLEFFKTLEKVAKEKSKIVTHIKPEGFAILNFDDEKVRLMAKNIKAQIISYGYASDADVRAVELENQGQGMDLKGLKFKLSSQGSTVPMFLPKVIGAHQIYAAMAAAAVGKALNMNLIEIAEGLKNYHSPKARMNLILGLKNSLIIDDTYNSSPQAAAAALDSVAKLQITEANHKVAVMGDMLELGDISDQVHYDLGEQVAQKGFDLGVFVGQYKEQMAKGAKAAGLNNVLTFADSVQAAQKLKQGIDANDIILVKGSQGARMEKIVKALMAQPEQAADLLVRQSDNWLNK